MSKNLSILQNHRHLTSFDLKSEIIFQALLEKNIDDLDIALKFNGTFFRRFSKDKMNISFDPVNDDIVNIDLSRNGFYDILPESICHNFSEREHGEDVVKEFKNRKREEKEARFFFNPIENELFRFRHQIEKYESDFFSKLNSNGIADIIKIVMAVEDKIPDSLIIKIFYALLKYNQNNEQSVDNVVLILEEIIDEKVKYRISNIKLEHTHDIEETSKELIMGINTTLASSQKIFLKRYDFEIGPLKNSENLENFFENHVMETFITTFFNLFLPFHIQFNFEIKLNKEDELFKIDDSTYKSRLGISTVL